MNFAIPLLVVTTVFLAYNFGIYRLKRKDSWKLNQNQSEELRRLHYVCLIIFLFLLPLNYFYDIRPRGIWTTRIIFSLVFLTGLCLLVIGNKYILQKFEKVYFYFWPLLPTISIIAFAIQPLKMSIVWDRIFNPISYVFFENSSYRVQNTCNGLFQRKREEVFEKKLFYEKKVKGYCGVKPNPDNMGKQDYYLYIFKGDYRKLDELYIGTK